MLEKEEVEEMVVKAFDLFADQEEKALSIASLTSFLWLSGCRISEALGIFRHHIKMDHENIYATITPLKQSHKSKRIKVSLVFPRKKTIFTKLIIKQTFATEEGKKLWDVDRTTAWRYLISLNPKIYPHIFRHSRVTHLADMGVGDDQLKRWFGWSARSYMPSTYIKYSKIQMERIGELLEEN